ncbi:hypothetical protein HPB51_028523 [Rhipicephalus microplus]|uniref:Uncharacterized protein n=1 Tax=Rhipicephalus microplus TaxID=6941 RepID=A0A9J6CWU0_RHIMP|nr:hypothetical protein HPB51_028523 [Rhipicephalus microplus]
MEVSFVKNLRDATKANRLTNLDSIGKMDPSWILADDLYQALALGDRVDYVLKLSILTPPMYHEGAPMALRMGTFGVELAKATIKAYEELRHQGHATTAIDDFQDCILAAMREEASLKQSFLACELFALTKPLFSPRMNCSSKEQSYHERGLPDLAAEWIARLEDSMMTAAAQDVALAVLKQSPSFDDDRPGDVPLTARQLFYVIHCYTYCGDEYGQFSYNQPLRHKADFADAFSCAPRSDMRAARQCKGF